jgi:hypothetical protein
MKIKFIIIITFILLIQGCEKSNQCCDEFPNPPAGLKHWQVLNVAGPITGLINQPLTLEITYPTSSGCDYVSNFLNVNCDNTILIKAFGTTLQNTPCTQTAVPKTISYDFTPTKKGKFTFKFINPDNSSISHNLTVN